MHKQIILAATLVAFTDITVSASTLEGVVKTHPSQGEVTNVDGANSSLIRGADGIYISLQTEGLIPGNVYTYWMVVFNAPANCETAPCSGKDALVRSEIVQSDAGYAGGAIVGNDGKLTMTAYQPVGALTNPFFDRGIESTDGLEVHLILQDHGAAIGGRELEMLSTYRGGCSDASIPPAFPDTARSQGSAGPNECRMVQFVAYPPE